VTDSFAECPSAIWVWPHPSLFFPETCSSLGLPGAGSPAQSRASTPEEPGCIVRIVRSLNTSPQPAHQTSLPISIVFEASQRQSVTTRESYLGLSGLQQLPAVPQQLEAVDTHHLRDLSSSSSSSRSQSPIDKGWKEQGRHWAQPGRLLSYKAWAWHPCWCSTHTTVAQRLTSI